MLLFSAAAAAAAAAVRDYVLRLAGWWLIITQEAVCLWVS